MKGKVGRGRKKRKEGGNSRLPFYFFGSGTQGRECVTLTSHWKIHHESYFTAHPEHFNPISTGRFFTNFLLGGRLLAPLIFSETTRDITIRLTPIVL